MRLQLVEIYKHSDSRGALSFVENGAPLPFSIGRSICIHPEQMRHFSLEELSVRGRAFAIALSGSCRLNESDNTSSREVELTTPDCGALIAEPNSNCHLSLSRDGVVLLLAEEEREVDHSSERVDGHNSTLEQCRIVELNHNDKGISLTNEVDLPFSVSRAYYLYDVPATQMRGAHAHKELYQLIIPLNGSFDVVLDDGSQKRRFTLSKPEEALLIVPGMWRDLERFSSPKAVCLVLASMLYTEQDYIRDYQEFLQFKQR